jgi:hypothetical protein
MTCGALTAGVVALGLEAGAIEDSRVRVLRMIALLAVRGRALDDDVNAFNRAVKLGHGLARWFTSVFGGTQCRALTGCDPASLAAVERYVESGRLRRCRAVAAAVAARVRSTLALLRAGSRLHEPPVAPT